MNILGVRGGQGLGESRGGSESVECQDGGEGHGVKRREGIGWKGGDFWGVKVVGAKEEGQMREKG